MVESKYKIIYADCPWKYEKLNMYEYKGVNKEVYPRMEIEEIKSLPVKDMADDNSLLFLWVTTPMLKKGLEVIESWGFEFSTIVFVWVKTYKGKSIAKALPREKKIITGMGRYTRNSVELVLLGKRGVGVKRIGTNVHQTIFSPIRDHSRKPDEIRNRIVELFGDVPRIELFARRRFDGWNTKGNQLEPYIQKYL